LWLGILSSLWGRWSKARRSPGDPRHEMGASGEALAGRYLRLRGWRILARNWRAPGGEIDLIVKRGRTVAFVEVRSRKAGSAVSPEDSVTAEKQSRISRAARYYLSQQKSDDRTCFRFDVITVEFPESGRPRVTHFPDAFKER